MSLNPFDTPTHRYRSRLETTRRQFLGVMGVFAGVGAALLGGFMSLKFLFPNSTLEEPAQFKVSEDPSTITIGNPLQITSKRVAVIRDDGGLYAVQLICTHLGCTPNYYSDVAGDLAPNLDERARLRGDRKPSERQPNGWKCPCHGSRYFIDSTNFYGPAPRPMDWVGISMAPDGKLIVDRSNIVVMRNPADITPPTWRFDDTTGRVITLNPAVLVNS